MSDSLAMKELNEEKAGVDIMLRARNVGFCVWGINSKILIQA